MERLIEEIRACVGNEYKRATGNNVDIAQLILKCAIETYGVDAQIDIAIEECSELIKALIKFRRNNGEGSTVVDVCEEVADVQIMLDQLRLIFDKQVIEDMRIDKLLRLKERYNEWQRKSNTPHLRRMNQN